MPRISRFRGIDIYMYYRDHDPPHIHARHGEHEARLVIETLQVLTGSLPAHALASVQHWMALHRDELLANWSRGRLRLPLVLIAPLS